VPPVVRIALVVLGLAIGFGPAVFDVPIPVVTPRWLDVSVAGVIAGVAVFLILWGTRPTPPRRRRRTSTI
jgi:hypothetical protein